MILKPLGNQDAPNLLKQDKKFCHLDEIIKLSTVSQVYSEIRFRISWTKVKLAASLYKLMF